jgi:chemotaxis protein MotA
MKSIAGLFLLVGVLGHSLASGQVLVFVNIHSIVLILGGTAAILLIMTPRGHLSDIVFCVRKLFWKNETPTDVSHSIVELSKQRRLRNENHPALIKYAQLLWDQGIEPEFFAVKLKQRIDHMEARHENAVLALKGLSKFPPALGMTGTVIGMVQLFSNLSDSSMNLIGPSLAHIGECGDFAPRGSYQSGSCLFRTNQPLPCAGASPDRLG